MVELNRYLVGMIAMLAFACGCSHNLKIFNLEKLPSRTCDFSQRGLRLKLIDGTMTEESDLLASEVARALATQADYNVQYNLRHATEYDAAVQISLKSDYSGSGANFLVSWPGFIFFTPAWLGYKYHARYEIAIDMSKVAGQPLTRVKTIPLHLEIRHSEFDRTWGAECGWTIVLFMAPIINGVYCISYDTDITEAIHAAAFPKIAASVATEIVNCLAGGEREASVARPPASAWRRTATVAPISKEMSPAAAHRTNTSVSKADALAELKRRYELGLCTEEEFNRDKERLAK